MSIPGREKKTRISELYFAGNQTGETLCCALHKVHDEQFGHCDDETERVEMEAEDHLDKRLSRVMPKHRFYAFRQTTV